MSFSTSFWSPPNLCAIWLVANCSLDVSCLAKTRTFDVCTYLLGLLCLRCAIQDEFKTLVKLALNLFAIVQIFKRVFRKLLLLLIRIFSAKLVYAPTNERV